MITITKTFVEQQIAFYNESQKLGLTPSQQETLIEGILDDNHIWETLREFFFDHMENYMK